MNQSQLPPNFSHRQSILSSWGGTLTGDREGDNQDAYLNWAERKFWSVADGLGGTEHGACASRLITRSFMTLGEPDSIESYINNVKKLLEEDNDFLLTQGKLAGTAASTVVTLLMYEGKAACVWSGDSRCYLLRNQMLYQCTKDHTLRQQKIDTGELTVPEAYRMVRGNIITGAIGVSKKLRLDEVVFPLRAGDRFLLCSDGLSNTLDGTSLTRVLQMPHPRMCIEAIRRTLADLPQPDNSTFVAVYLSMK